MNSTTGSILVTGSSGFLGGNVARHLASSGHAVRGFDLIPPTTHDISTTIGDLTDAQSVMAAVAGFDTVVHFGGIGDTELATRDPGLAASVNVLGTTNIGLAAARHDARVLYASTWEVYAPQISGEIDENFALAPSDAYSVSKLGGEMMLGALHESQGLRVAILRLGTAFGTGMRPNSVFERLTHAAQSGEVLSVHGDDGQFRQFTHATDIALGVERVIDQPWASEVINLVAPEVVTILQLAEIVAARYGSSIEFVPSRSIDPPSAIVSSAKARLLYGWEPAAPFSERMNTYLTQR